MVILIGKPSGTDTTISVMAIISVASPYSIAPSVVALLQSKIMQRPTTIRMPMT